MATINKALENPLTARKPAQKKNWKSIKFTFGH